MKAVDSFFFIWETSSMFFSDFFIPFVAIALAELGDKSQILAFMLASRTKKHFQLLMGVMLGFFVVDGFAIWVGSWVVNLVPAFWLNVVAGLVFVVFGVLMLFTKQDDSEREPHLRNPFVTGFFAILLTEWGDKTQIAGALFATQYRPEIVFIAVMAALFLLSASAIYLGKFVAHKINKHLVTKIAGVVFIAVGLLSLFYDA